MQVKLNIIMEPTTITEGKQTFVCCVIFGAWDVQDPETPIVLNASMGTISGPTTQFVMKCVPLDNTT